MIKKLRIKLIGVSMLSLFIVFSIIMGAISVINYMDVIADADSILNILAENKGFFPKQGDHSNNDTQMADRPRKNRQLSPELPYESRYFSVLFNSDGEVKLVDTGKIAAVDTNSAIEFATDVWEGGDTQGFMDDYRYIVHTTGTETRIIFLDCGRSLSTFRSFVFTSICVFLLGMLAVLLLIIFLSGYIIKPISESYEKQKQFITDAGHEIKTPLTVIDADAEILTMDFGENEWLSDIQNQTKRLTALTNDLILLSRLEENQARFQMIDFPLSDMLEEMAHSFQALAITQEKVFSVDIQPMLSFRGDEKALRQLVSVLLDNALKYSEKGGKISLSLEKYGSNIRLSVFNTTEFIARDHLPYLFDRFYRTDKSRNSQTGGHGLGLSIAAAVVASHKGKIVASTEDEHSLLITAAFHAQ